MQEPVLGVFNPLRLGDKWSGVLGTNIDVLVEIFKSISRSDVLIASQCRRDSQTTTETISQRSSHANSRRDSGTSSIVRSRRNSDCEGHKKHENNESSQMFPDLPSATSYSSNNNYSNTTNNSHSPNNKNINKFHISESNIYCKIKNLISNI